MEICIAPLPGMKGTCQETWLFLCILQPWKTELKRTQIQKVNPFPGLDSTCITSYNLRFLLFLFAVRAIYKTLALPLSILSHLWRELSFCLIAHTVLVWYYYPLQSSSGQLGDVDATSFVSLAAFPCWTFVLLEFWMRAEVKSYRARTEGLRQSVTIQAQTCWDAGIQLPGDRVSPSWEEFISVWFYLRVLHAYLWRFVFVWLTQ